MKFSLNAWALASLLALGMTGCNSATTTTSDSGAAAPSANAETSTPGNSDLGHEGTYVDYSDDWGAFKSAVANKNLDGMALS